MRGLSSISGVSHQASVLPSTHSEKSSSHPEIIVGRIFVNFRRGGYDVDLLYGFKLKKINNKKN